MKSSPDSPDAGRRMEQMVSRLRAHGCRMTPQRMAVLRVLAASQGHPSAERVYEAVRQEFPTTSIATIYKTIHLLKQMGEVLEIAVPEGSNRYDGNKPHPHPHVICVRCRRIIDPDLASLQDVTAELAQATGFEILSHRLDFFGICKECRQNDQNQARTTGGHP
jgi:Fur family peroxide stress response transcriptional regulator